MLMPQEEEVVKVVVVCVLLDIKSEELELQKQLVERLVLPVVRPFMPLQLLEFLTIQHKLLM
jgi:hypothetical protein